MSFLCVPLSLKPFEILMMAFHKGIASILCTTDIVSYNTTIVSSDGCFIQLRN